MSEKNPRCPAHHVFELPEGGQHFGTLPQEGQCFLAPAAINFLAEPGPEAVLLMLQIEPEDLLQNLLALRRLGATPRRTALEPAAKRLLSACRSASKALLGRGRCLLGSPRAPGIRCGSFLRTGGSGH